MGESYQRRLVMLFCFRSKEALSTLDEQELAFAMRITCAELETTKQVFIQKGFIDDQWLVLNWDKRQFSVQQAQQERHREKRAAIGLPRRRWINPSVREQVLARDARSCVYCNSKENITLDHIVAESKGGLSSPDNLVTACRSCNGKKREFSMDEAGMRYRDGYLPPSKPHARTSKGLASTDTDTDTEQIHIQTQKQKLCVPISKPIQLGERTRFHEWWGLWSRTRGTAFRDLACTTYISIVSAEKEQACMDCTTSYLASIEPHKGYRPENFLIEMARDNFAATFTPRLNGNINRNFRAEKKAAEDEQFREGMLDLARRKGLA